MPEAFPEPEAIRNAAAAILRNPDYTLNLYEPPYTSVLRSFLEHLNDLLRPIFKALESVWNLPPLLLWPLAILALLLGTFLTWQAIRAVHRVAAKRRLKEYHPASAEEVKDAEYWRCEAERLAAAGDFLTALRLLFRSGLLRLENGKVRKAATNREYLRRYRNTPAEQPLRVLVQLVDYKWYGGRECIGRDWEEGRAAYQQLCGEPVAASADDRKGA